MFREDGTSCSGSRGTGPLLDAATVKIVDIAQEPNDDVLRCLAPPLHRNGTEDSDGHNHCGAGIRRQRMILFDQTTRYVTASTFWRHAVLTTMLLNFFILTAPVNASETVLLLPHADMVVSDSNAQGDAHWDTLWRVSTKHSQYC